ncbi:MAG: glutamine synthetase [Prevotella sp.]|nr:glutamine synthetase [Prevotella sp.]
MENEQIQMNANVLVEELEKHPSEFTREDIIKYVVKHGIRMVNFMYPGGDGKLKMLNFVLSDVAYLRTILTCGERVDGSSLFDFIQASSSDLYVLPRYDSAFIDPFSEEPTLCMLCSFFDKDGHPMESSPDHTLRKAVKAFREKTGMEFQAMGELEYYVIKPSEGKFPGRDQHGYHESAPFAKAGDFRKKCMRYIAQTGGHIKYGHTEVGCFEQDGLLYEQNEIEFLPIAAEHAADELMLAKWVIYNLAWREGLTVTFAPKITSGKAGSGLHIHMRLMREGKNMLVERGGVLTDNARRAIAGLMDLAPSLTAFGNKNPTSYFRLVPHQEAPTNVCWGDRNRSVLVRVPLGWTSGIDMSHTANPMEEEVPMEMRGSDKQTFEIRSGDGSADVYQYLAALCVACRHGFEMQDATEIAERTYVDVNIHDEANAHRLDQLDQLPDSCAASADCLERQRGAYEELGIFSANMIDGILRQLRDYHDRTLRTDIHGNGDAIRRLINRFFYCG